MDDAGHCAEVPIEDGAIHEQNRAQRLILSGGADLPFSGEPGQEPGPFTAAHRVWMPLLMEQDEAAVPGDVCLFGAAAETSHTAGEPAMVQDAVEGAAWHGDAASAFRPGRLEGPLATAAQTRSGSPCLLE
jgi:hypothetical protein